MGRRVRSTFVQAARLIVMVKGIQIVTDVASAIVRHIGHISAWLGLALVCVVSFNVISRYLFGFGNVGMQEAEWHLMAVGALMGMSYGLNQGGEVRVDIFYARFSPRLQAWVDLFATLLLVAIALIIAWLSIKYVQNSYTINEGSPDPGGLAYRYVLKGFIPLSFVLLAIQGIAMTGHALLTILAPARTDKHDGADHAIH